MSQDSEERSQNEKESIDDLSSTDNTDTSENGVESADTSDGENSIESADTSNEDIESIYTTNNENGVEPPKISDNSKPIKNNMLIGLIVAIGVAAFFAGWTASDMSSGITQQDLDDTIAKLELKILQNQLPQQPKEISADDDPVIGDPNAPITIIEFSDFQCPFCARFNSQTLPMIIDQYINQGTVKLVFRDFPIQSIHPNAVAASIAAECADEQAKFKAMHDVLFDKQQEWNEVETVQALEMFVQYAVQIEIEQEAFESCLTSGRYIDEIRNDLNDGRDYGVTGTPGFFIGNENIGYVELKGAQPFESFKNVIDMQLGT